MTSRSNTTHTEQHILNQSCDENFSQQLAVEKLDFDGDSLQREVSSLVAQKITISGNDTYVAIAPIGTSQETAKWQVKKITVSGNDTVITWADGNSDFDNVATDLTDLSYL